MSTYHIVCQKLRHHPIDLTPDDIRALKARNPWLAKAAVNAWRSAQWWKQYREKYPAPAAKRPLPVVRAQR